MKDARQRLSARDYKQAARTPGGFDFSQYQQFGIGPCGRARRRSGRVAVRPSRATQGGTGTCRCERTRGARRQARAQAIRRRETEADPARDYAFYEALPKFEVTVPEKDHGARRDLPEEPIVQAGAYVLQVGSYRNRPDADRLADKLAKLGIPAGVQHIAIDTDEWNRVRIGPISDLNKLNATRRQLKAADIDAVIYRVGD